MTAFALVVALLLSGVLLMLAPPLWRTAGIAAGESASRRRLSAWLLILGLPLASIGTYLKLGDLRPLAADSATAARTAPGTAEGWLAQGRSYVALGRFRDAATAWRRAAELRPDDATVLADFADVLAMAQGRRLAGEPARLVQRALDADPRHLKALALAGSVAYESRDYAAARGYWERALAVVPADSDAARSMRANIAQATRLDAAMAGVAPTASTAAAGASALSIEIRLAPALQARVAPGDTLFVVARPAQGARMPLASIGTYLKLGDLRPLAAGGAAVQAVPGTAEGWLVQGRSYVALGRFRDAATAWRRAAELRPDDATVLADFADVLAMAQGRRLAGEPARLVQRALDADPRHLKALALAGSVAYESRDYAAARGYWERALAVVPADSEVARSMRANIAQATRLDAAMAGVAPTASTAAATALSIEVRLAPALQARVAPGDTLFVVARPAQGTRMPLAALRQPAGAWPVTVSLGDAQSLQPARPLSGEREVVVVARLSRSGQAAPQPGDLLGESAPVSPSASGLQVLIDRVQP